MAIRVLVSIGWEPGCVYTDTLYQVEVEGSKICWGDILPDEPTPQQRTCGENEIEANLWEWKHKEIASVQMVLGQEGRAIYSANYVVGRMIGGNASALTALALTTGLGNMHKLLVGQPGTECDMLAKLEEIVVYTDYEPLHNSTQRDRWRL